MRAPAWLGHQAPRGVSGSYVECIGSRQSPDPCLVEARLEPGLLPSSVVVLSAECYRYYEPLRLPTRLHPLDGARRATPRRVGSPVLPCVLCRRATPLTPARKPAVIGRVLTQTPAAFPVIQAGRPSRHHFRGLLRLHTCCGPSACGPTRSGPLSQELRHGSYPSCRLGSYWGVPTTPQTGLAPVRHTAPFHGALNNAG